MAGYTRITNYPVIGDWNDNYSALELNSTYSFGRGILSGLTLSAGTGLSLNVAAGTLMGLKAVSISGTSTTVPDASTNYVWINESGSFTTSATTADPGGTYVCLGKVTAAGGVITTIDVTLATGGRMSVWRWTGIRVAQIGESLIYCDLANGWVGIGKTPAGTFDVSGTIYSTGLQINSIDVSPAILSAGNLTAQMSFGGM